jgi:SET domain-containing protein
MGRGVESLKDFAVGDVIHEAEILVLNEDDTKKVNETELKHYTFVFDEGRDCLVLGLGEIFNHDDSPNASYRLKYVGGRMVMAFYAVKDIKPNEQIFIDYNKDIRVNIAEYLGAKSLT